MERAQHKYAFRLGPGNRAASIETVHYLVLLADHEINDRLRIKSLQGVEYPKASYLCLVFVGCCVVVRISSHSHQNYSWTVDGVKIGHRAT
eukprot:scaffold127323_cov31-Tisochrysis_lutea.AAC.2